MDLRNLSAIRWIVVGDLLSISRRRRVFLLPAIGIGLLLVIAVGIIALAESAIGFAATVLLLSVVMSTTLSLQWVVRSSIEDGSIGQLFLSAQPTAVIVAGKVFSHWLLSGLPCLSLVLLSGVAMNVEADLLLRLLGCLLLSTPIVSVIATMVTIRSGGRASVIPEAGDEASGRRLAVCPRRAREHVLENDHA